MLLVWGVVPRALPLGLISVPPVLLLTYLTGPLLLLVVLQRPLGLAVAAESLVKTKKTMKVRIRVTMKIRNLMNLKETTWVFSPPRSMMKMIKKLTLFGRPSIRGWIQGGKIEERQG